MVSYLNNDVLWYLYNDVQKEYCQVDIFIDLLSKATRITLLIYKLRVYKQISDCILEKCVPSSRLLIFLQSLYYFLFIEST